MMRCLQAEGKNLQKANNYDLLYVGGLEPNLQYVQGHDCPHFIAVVWDQIDNISEVCLY